MTYYGKKHEQIFWRRYKLCTSVLFSFLHLEDFVLKLSFGLDLFLCVKIRQLLESLLSSPNFSLKRNPALPLFATFTGYIRKNIRPYPVI